MAKFLFVSYGQEGHLHPPLAIARRLRERGHEVAVMTAPHKEAAIRAAGLTYLRPASWKASLLEITGADAPGLLASIQEAYKVFKEILFPDGLAQLADLEAHLPAFRPDVIVGSQITYGVPAFARKHGIKWATHSILPACPLPSKDLFPWGLGIGRADGALQRLQAAIARQGQNVVLGPLVRHWNGLMRERGLAADYDDVVTITLGPDLFTIPSPPGFDLPRSDLPKQVRYVGTCLWHEGQDATGWENPFTDGKPLVYCSAGTIFTGPEFYKRAIEAARGQDFNLLALIGRSADPAIYEPLPPNVRLAAYIPQNLVMKEAAAVLCHGGGGTLMSGLAHGHPVVIIPYASDQPENAARCAQQGVGLHLDRKTCTPESLRAALLRVLREPGFREGAQRFAGLIAAHDGAVNAADELERLLPAAAPAPALSA